jgi:heme/copper-type cytochrome/quinol oxidase subunit 2
VDLAIPKRGPGEIRVTVSFDTAGRYEFVCSRMCGAGHNYMRGEIIVRDPAAPR